MKQFKYWIYQSLIGVLIATMALGSTLQANVPRPDSPFIPQGNDQDFSSLSFEEQQLVTKLLQEQANLPQFNLLQELENTKYDKERFRKLSPSEKRRELMTIAREMLFGSLPIAALWGAKSIMGITPLDPTLWMFAGFSIIALQRYLWQTITAIRANLYLNVIYPKIKKAADEVLFEDIPQNLMVVPTYAEDGLVSKKVFQALASQAKDLPKPIIMAVSAKNKVNIEKRNKNLDSDPQDDEHDFLEAQVRQVESRTISVEMDQDFPDETELAFVRAIQGIVEENDAQRRQHLIDAFEPKWGARLREEMNLEKDSPFVLPRIIILKLYQDARKDILLTESTMVIDREGQESFLNLPDNDLTMMRYVLDIAEENDLDVKESLILELERKWQKATQEAMGVQLDDEVSLPKEMLFSFTQTLPTSTHPHYQVIKGTIGIDYENPDQEELSLLKGIVEVAEKGESTSSNAKLQSIWNEVMTRDLHEEQLASLLGPVRIEQVPLHSEGESRSAIKIRMFQDVFVEIPRERWEGDKKRFAIGSGLRALGHVGAPDESVGYKGFSDDAVVWLMDGDSLATPGVLATCSKVMKATNCHAITTKETVHFVDREKTGVGGAVLHNFFEGHMMKRHTGLSAQAASQLLLVLTGRFSGVSWNVAKLPQFSQLIQTDVGMSAIWDKIAFLSGDDKSSLFAIFKFFFDFNKQIEEMPKQGDPAYMVDDRIDHKRFVLLLEEIAKKGLLRPRMVYVPDANVVSLENVIAKGPLAHAITNMQRWFGNMLRNVFRLLNLGPKFLGAYNQIAVMDQLINPFTGTLVVNLVALSLVGFLMGTEPITNFTRIITWILFSTAVQLTTVFKNWEGGMKFSNYVKQVPLQVVVRFIAAPIKVGTFPALGVQKWVRHGQSRESAGSKLDVMFKKTLMQVSRAILFSSVLVSALFIKGKFDVGDYVQMLTNPAQTSRQVVKSGSRTEITIDGSLSSANIQSQIQGALQRSENGKVNVFFDGEVFLDQPLVIANGDDVQLGTKPNSGSLHLYSLEGTPALIVLDGGRASLRNTTIHKHTSENSEVVLVEVDGGVMYAESVDVKGKAVVSNGGSVEQINSVFDSFEVDETSSYSNSLGF